MSDFGRPQGAKIGHITRPGGGGSARGGYGRKEARWRGEAALRVTEVGSTVCYPTLNSPVNVSASASKYPASD